jgi:hypothetical protein
MVDNIGTTIGKFTTKVQPTLESIPKWVAFGAAIVASLLVAAIPYWVVTGEDTVDTLLLNK